MVLWMAPQSWMVGRRAEAKGLGGLVDGAGSVFSACCCCCPSRMSWCRLLGTGRFLQALTSSATRLSMACHSSWVSVEEGDDDGDEAGGESSQDPKTQTSVSGRQVRSTKAINHGSS